MRPYLYYVALDELIRTKEKNKEKKYFFLCQRVEGSRMEQYFYIYDN